MLILDNCNFMLTPTVSAIDSEESTIDINGCSFITDNTIVPMEFINTPETKGGVIYAANVQGFIITNSHFEGMNIAIEGGVIYLARLSSSLEFTGGIFMEITVRNSTFLSNSASLGGAIYLNNEIYFNIESCVFDSNSAKQINGTGGDGGAIYYYSTSGKLSFLSFYPYI